MRSIGWRAKAHTNPCARSGSAGSALIWPSRQHSVNRIPRISRGKQREPALKTMKCDQHFRPLLQNVVRRFSISHLHDQPLIHHIRQLPADRLVAQLGAQLSELAIGNAAALDFLEAHNLRLPDEAQALIPECGTWPDFLYRELLDSAPRMTGNRELRCFSRSADMRSGRNTRLHPQPSQ